MDTKPTYRQNSLSRSLFEQDATVCEFSKLGNPLEKLAELVDFEMFRPTLEKALSNPGRKSNAGLKSNAGRKPVDLLFIFKVFILQRLYGLSDEQTESQIVDRTSIRNFLCILRVEDIIDARTMWKCRDILAAKGTFDKLFIDFNALLDFKGLIVNGGKIVDASFVTALR